MSEQISTGRIVATFEPPFEPRGLCLRCRHLGWVDERVGVCCAREGEDVIVYTENNVTAHCRHGFLRVKPDV